MIDLEDLRDAAAWCVEWVYIIAATALIIGACAGAGYLLLSNGESVGELEAPAYTCHPDDGPCTPPWEE